MNAATANIVTKQNSPDAMPQSLAQIYVHLVFSTKDRRPFLDDCETRSRTHAYLSGGCREQGCPSVIIGGPSYHVHVLLRLGKSTSISNLVRELKKESSKWIKSEFPSLQAFQWQAGYGAFSVSPSHVDALVSYIRNQEEHHRVESFQDEFRRLCAKYDVALDERYVWD